MGTPTCPLDGYWRGDSCSWTLCRGGNSTHQREWWSVKLRPSASLEFYFTYCALCLRDSWHHNMSGNAPDAVDWDDEHSQAGQAGKIGDRTPQGSPSDGKPQGAPQHPELGGLPRQPQRQKPATAGTGGITIGGNVTQQSAGDCSPNIIGSGNTSTCVTPALAITDAESKAFTAHLKRSPAITGSVDIMYEFGVENGAEQAEKIRAALEAAGITATSSGAQIIGGCEGDFPPGISLSCVVPGNRALADAVADALFASRIIKKPIKVPKELPWPNQSFGLMIHKP